MPYFPPTGGGGADTGQFPIAVAGNTVSIGRGLNPAIQYVSPAATSSDSNDGLTWQTAKKTGWAAYQVIKAAGGGTIYVADRTYWVDPVSTPIGAVQNGGPWFRHDGFLPAGWDVNVPVVIEGVGPSNALGLPTAFQGTGISVIYAGSNDAADYRTKPGVWLAYCDLPVEFRNIQVSPVPGHAIGDDGNNCAYRSGWDYNRNFDGSVAYLAITSSTRTGSAPSSVYADLIPPGSTARVTNHSCAMSKPVTIESASRDSSNVTTLVMHYGDGDHGTCPPFAVGVQINVQFTAPGFNSGTYTVASTVVTQLAVTNWTITLTGEGVGVQPSTPNPGTLSSSVTAPGDLLDVQSNSSEFPSGQYLCVGTSVTDATHCVISVMDIWGGTDGRSATVGPVANIGQLAHQERGMYPTVRNQFTNCTARAFTSDTGYLNWGPMFDVAASTAFGPIMTNCFVEGYMPSSSANPPFGTPYTSLAHPYDDIRTCAVLVYGAQLTSPTLYIQGITGTQAMIRGVFNNVALGGGNAWSFVLNDAVFDSSNGQPPAMYRLNGNRACQKLDGNNVIVADFNPGFGPGLNVNTGTPAGLISGNAFVGNWPSAAPSNNVITSARPTSSPWSIPQIGLWKPRLESSAPHPAAWRDMSPAFRRFDEQSRALTSWGVTPTATGIDDPLGGTGAWQYNSTVVSNILVFSFDRTFNLSPGDRFALVTYKRGTGTWASDSFWALHLFGGATWKCDDTAGYASGTDIASGPADFKGSGWQWEQHVAKVLTGGAAQNLQALFVPPVNGLGGTLDFFATSLLYIPATAGLTDPDIDEYLGTLKPTPHDLPTGMAGTFENQKFIAHGGLGSAKHYVSGVSSGQITLGAANSKYVELFDETGASLGVFGPGSAFTVNP